MQLQAIRLPRWQELPPLYLYMDQVIYLLEEVLAPLTPPGEKVVTATMINNYVKHKLVAPSQKKKYGREQLAALILIGVCKRALSLAEIALLWDHLLVEDEPQAAYDRFAAGFEEALTAVNNDQALPIRQESLFLDAALAAVTAKLLVEQYLRFSPPQPPTAAKSAAE